MIKGLKSLLAGLLAGTALGILFSPKKGEELRKEIKSEIDEGGTGFSAVTGTMSEMGKEIGGKCKEYYEDLNENEKFVEGKDKAKKFAKKTYKENVPAETRKKIKKGYKKAKKSAKETVKKVSKKVSKKKSQ